MKWQVRKSIGNKSKNFLEVKIKPEGTQEQINTAGNALQEREGGN